MAALIFGGADELQRLLEEVRIYLVCEIADDPTLVDPETTTGAIKKAFDEYEATRVELIRAGSMMGVPPAVTSALKMINGREIWCAYGHTKASPSHLPVLGMGDDAMSAVEDLARALVSRLNREYELRAALESKLSRVREELHKVVERAR